MIKMKVINFNTVNFVEKVKALKWNYYYYYYYRKLSTEASSVLLTEKTAENSNINLNLKSENKLKIENEDDYYFENVQKNLNLNNNPLKNFKNKARENLNLKIETRENLNNSKIEAREDLNLKIKARENLKIKTRENLNLKKQNLKSGPNLSDFITNTVLKYSNETEIAPEEAHPYLPSLNAYGKKVFFDVYGCQMNVSDTEIIYSVLKSAGYERTLTLEEADVILVVTCAIRDGAEQKVWGRLASLNNLRRRRHLMGSPPLRVGLLGCMAERLKNKILEESKYVDLVAGPDAYRDLPRLLSVTEENQAAINVALSFDETYADINPVRLNGDSKSAFVTIMRGCDNMCTYCIVPFVRGRERSRPIKSILDEVRHLADSGVKEVTLLGQNVNSYRDLSEEMFPVQEKKSTELAKGFKTVYKNKIGGRRFADLLEKVAEIDPEMRIRFTSPHPKDFPDEVLHLISTKPNICKQIHLPAQSGNSAVLERMRRGYTRESYLELVNHIRELIPDIQLSSDFIAGFCGETDAEFEDTLTLMEKVQYHVAYLFQYSMREKTTAHRRFQDDVPPEVKLERMQRMANLFRAQAEKLNSQLIGTRQLVLIEGVSRRSESTLQGRTDGNTRVLIPNVEIPDGSVNRPISAGDYVVVGISTSNSNSLTGVPVSHSSISEFDKSSR
ncbi:GSCOCG00006718001-RA-CDS [Cotesia congregata]|nr:GSCOCG00006718001-RA-CDS [Cotesia congregata]